MVLKEKQVQRKKPIPKNKNVLLYSTDKYPLQKAHGDEDAGYDLYCVRQETDLPGQKIKCYTGIRVEIPKGYFGLLVVRSSLQKQFVHLANDVGIIDSGYRGEIIVMLTSTTGKFPLPNLVDKKIAQLILIRNDAFEPVIVEELNGSERGEKGFGSSGE